MIPVFPPGDGRHGLLDALDPAGELLERCGQSVDADMDRTQSADIRVDLLDQAFECRVRVFIGAAEVLGLNVEHPSDSLYFSGLRGGSSHFPPLIGGPVDADLLCHLGLGQISAFAGGS